MITVLVSAAGCGIGHNVIRCLRMHPKIYRVIAAEVDPLLIGLRLGDVNVLLDKNWKKWTKQINEVCEREDVDIIVPCHDIEIDYLASKTNQFKAMILVAAPTVTTIARDKYATSIWLEANHFLSPKTYLLNNVNKSKITFPTLIKPRAGTGSRHVYKVHDWKELEVLNKRAQRDGYEMIIQELLEGEEYSGQTAVALDGSILATTCAWSVKKYGISFKTIHSGEEGMLGQKALIEAIAKKIHVRGSALSIQMIKQDGKFYIFEMNPRFTGAQAMRAYLGVNMPHILIQNYLYNKKIYQKIKREDTAFWYYDWVFKEEFPLQYLKRRFMG